MKKTATFRGLVKDLGRDPAVKKAMTRAKRGSQAKDRARVEQATGLVSLMLSVVSSFSKKKRARTLDEVRDAIYFLVQVSLLLKENLFDRPEVKRFFRQKSKQIYQFAEQCVALVVPKTKGVRDVPDSRPV